jgi:hypothetical protein
MFEDILESTKKFNAAGIKQKYENSKLIKNKISAYLYIKIIN